MRRLGGLLALGLLLSMFVVWPARAADNPPQNRGLFITPLRSYITADPSKTQGDSLTVANITDKTITVTMSVQQFAVADYTYEYKFRTSSEDWVHLSATQFQLQPGKSQTVAYNITPPLDASPGGHYFTIFATTTLQQGSVASRVQAATVLYVSVNGDLRKTSSIVRTRIDPFSFGDDINYDVTAKNTGNTHFFTYTSGQLEGWFTSNQGRESTHILMPDTSRTTSGAIPAPILPGVYKATFGYRTDTGDTLQRSAYVVVVPLWSIALPIGIVLLSIAIRNRRT